MKALYIGRFQPFHNGHFLVVQRISKEYEALIIGIGSSQDHDSAENPFSEQERMRMIAQSLDASDIKNYQIVPIPDIHDPPRWVAHVQEIVADFDVVITNNPFTRTLFSEKGFTVEGTPYFQRELYTGKEIRRRMRCNEPWEHLVPDPVVKIIMEIDGIQRIKQLNGSPC
jgi:nicotinamide-nucleotide adenylyltransferase